MLKKNGVGEDKKNFIKGKKTHPIKIFKEVNKRLRGFCVHKSSLGCWGKTKENNK